MAGLQLYNTLTRRVEPFTPLYPGEARIYTCGPTVYDYATIGNMRAYIFSDILRRTLEYHGYAVKQVMNITDVGHLVSDADEGEDKMLVGMRREGKTPWEIAEFYTGVFFQHAAQLNIKRPSIVARATEHIPEMIAFIKRLEDLGYTYEINDGVYFDISRFGAYGQLSRLDLDGQQAGARVEVNPEKRHPADFALWRKASPTHIMQWASPWGQGFPGWHIECSAMSHKYLGDRFDIHTGGVDHVPIHHEDEIAQNDAAFGHRVVERWMHNEFLLIDGGRMGKSLGNRYTVDDLSERGLEPLAFRYLNLNAHYRSKLNFTWEALRGAHTALLRLWGRVGEMAAELTEAERGRLLDGESAAAAADGFAAAVGEDLGTPGALPLMWAAARGDAGPAASLAALLDMDRVLGLSLDRAVRGELGRAPASAEDLSPEVEKLLAEREAARARRDWAAADDIRDRLAAMGLAVTDTPEGPVVRRQ